jgi:hypothetical protein
MNLKANLIVVIAVLAGAVVIIHLYKAFETTTNPPPQIKLEEVISVKELHLVKHHYNDQFYLHRKNDRRKSVRVIADIPVTVTAYIDLKAVKVIHSGDSIKEIVLARAKMLEPQYHLSELQVTKTRQFILYAGKDLYPEVSAYLKDNIATRSALIKERAIQNNILHQAETEAKAYVESLLKAIGHPNVSVVYD